MPRIAIFNMFIGFTVIFLAAAAGAFIANDTTIAFQKNKELLSSWQMILSTSAHGHSNLFGLLHIAFGLTIPYSTYTIGIKKWQTFGLFAGTFAMSILMLIKSYSPPAVDENPLSLLNVLIALCLSMTLVTVATHSFGLFKKLMQR